MDDCKTTTTSTLSTTTMEKRRSVSNAPGKQHLLPSLPLHLLLQLVGKGEKVVEA